MVTFANFKIRETVFERTPNIVVVVVVVVVVIIVFSNIIIAGFIISLVDIRIRFILFNNFQQILS